MLHYLLLQILLENGLNQKVISFSSNKIKVCVNVYHRSTVFETILTINLKLFIGIFTDVLTAPSFNETLME